ncbi:MAG TPA: cupin domain-containing protein [Allosphingosinicella sp.]|jgi:ribosomal protein L16 Arg81 hydroxylase
MAIVAAATATAAAAADAARRQRPVASWREGVLAFLTAPIAPDAFLADHYEQAPLVGLHGEPERFASLLTLARVDRFLAEADLRGNMVRLANHHDPVPEARYVDAEGRIDATAVAREYQNGSTIVLNELHEWIPELGAFCRGVEQCFSAQVTTNVYLTPAGNQGFPPHYDNHDVFVMQVSGRKLWRLWETPIDTPYRGERFEQSGFVAETVSREFVLEPGDCAYIPRGAMHDAENVGEEPSLHITVGLFTKKWAELVLEAVSELALAEPEFRRSLPPGFATRDFDRAAADAHFARLLALVGEKAEMDGAFDLLADGFSRDRRPNVAGVILHGKPRAGDRFRARRFVPWNVAEDEAGRIVLVGPGGDLAFDPADGGALDLALSGEAFAAEDLAGEGGAAVLEELWAGGYLERVT